MDMLAGYSSLGLIPEFYFSVECGPEIAQPTEIYREITETAY